MVTLKSYPQINDKTQVIDHPQIHNYTQIHGYPHINDRSYNYVIHAWASVLS